MQADFSISPALERTTEGVQVRYGMTCRMPDGLELVADVYTPVGEGPFPVLLMRQPYGRDIASTVVYAQPTWFCRQGFIVVIQDVRGRGDSEGDFNAFQYEAEDGFHTIRWAARLDQSNGHVGMYGFSYQGSTQLLAATRRPPELKAMAPHMTAFDLYSGWFYRDGMLQQQSTLSWGNQMLREDARRAGQWDLYRRLEASYANPSQLLRQFPLREVQPLTDPGAAPYVRSWLERDQPDEYWQNLDTLSRAAELADIPCFHLTGWYDFFTRGSMDGYRAMVRHCPEKQKLVAGPWSHIPWGTRIGGTALGKGARYPVDEQLVEWMLHWCGAEDPGPVRGSPVTYFSMGDLRWHETATWPPPEAAARSFYLGSHGGANSLFGDGALLEDAKRAKETGDRFIYDPEVPVWGPGVGTTGYNWGPVDLFASQQGNNLLVYQSAQWNQPRSFAGQPVGHLWVQSSASHTAFVLRLSIHRNGISEFLCLGAARLTPEHRLPDGSAFLEVFLDDIAFTIMPAESLCLDIASSAYPLLARHPNTATPLNAVPGAEAFQRATQVILHDSLHPSRLILKEVPNAS